MHRQRGDIFAVEQYAPFVRRDQADDHVKSSRLSRTVRPQQTDDLSASDFDGYSFDDITKFVALGDILNTENTHGSVFSEPVDALVS